MDRPEGTWHLEQRIWECIGQAYGGKSTEIANLQQRLSTNFRDKPKDQTATQRGLENIDLCDLKQASIQEVVDGRFKSYRRDVAKGVRFVYDDDNPSFLKTNLRKKKDWLARYAALLHIFDRENPLVKKVTDFIEDIQTLLRIYHNITLEHQLFFQQMTYDRYRSSINNIQQNMRDLDSIKSDDVIVQSYLENLKILSIHFSAAVLFGFYYTLTLRDVKKEGINLNELAARREEIVKQIESVPSQFQSQWLKS